jgi:hypothetical protein
MPEKCSHSNCSIHSSLATQVEGGDGQGQRTHGGDGHDDDHGDGEHDDDAAKGDYCLIYVFLLFDKDEIYMK